VKGKDGDLIRIAPVWTKWIFWMVLAAFVIGTVFVTVGTYTEYASGPMVVLDRGRTTLVAEKPGVVVAVEAEPGGAVQSGRMLIRYADSSRNNGVFDEAVVVETVVSSPVDGTVVDLPVEPGNRVSPGDVLAVVDAEQHDFRFVAFLPAERKVRIEPGMEVRLEFNGYKYAFQAAALESVGERVLGPGEVRKYLGARAEVAVAGPVVPVHGRFESAVFEAEGESLSLFEGMQGRADIKIQSERILFHLLPRMKAFFGEEG
jgi:membrane fusion protein (multidrug efflux system)